MKDRINSEELARLIEAEKTDLGYEFMLRNQRYLSSIDCDSVQRYSKIVIEIMEHIDELVESGSVTADAIEKMDHEVESEYEDCDDTFFIVCRINIARKKGIIDDKLEASVNRLSEVKGIPSGSTWHLLMDRPTFLSAVLSVMDIYSHNYKKEADYYYGAGAYFLLRIVLTKDHRTSEIE